MNEAIVASFKVIWRPRPDGVGHAETAELLAAVNRAKRKAAKALARLAKARKGKAKKARKASKRACAHLLACQRERDVAFLRLA